MVPSLKEVYIDSQERQKGNGCCDLGPQKRDQPILPQAKGERKGEDRVCGGRGVQLSLRICTDGCQGVEGRGTVGWQSRPCRGNISGSEHLDFGVRMGSRLQR